MADLEGNLNARNFHTDTPATKLTSHVKGTDNLDFGIKRRLGRIFDPADGRTLMLAFDHGYFQGPTRGLERIDLNIAPLGEYADALMGTRGIFRSSFPADGRTPLVVRASGGPSVLRELSDEHIAMDMEDACRIDASALAVQVFIGSENESRSIQNMTTLVDGGLRYGIPVLGVTAVGKDMVRDSRYLGLATRMIAELGAHMVKTYYCEEDFEHITAACPIPVIVAGGKKVPVRDALEMAYRAFDAGAAGVDMGRNIFQRQNPAAMIQAVRGLVHDRLGVDDAVQKYADLSGGAED